VGINSSQVAKVRNCDGDAVSTRGIAYRANRAEDCRPLQRLDIATGLQREQTIMPKATRFHELFYLDEKIAVVTGGGMGIGREIGLLLSDAGARVAIADINADAARRTAADINAAGGKAIAVTCDVSDKNSVDRMFEDVAGKLGPIGILVNNAGIYPHEDFFEITPDAIDRILSVNVRGTMLCTQRAVQAMRASGKGGRIVNITSAAGARPVCTDSTIYGASKAGISNITQSTALEFAADGILVNAVAPGGIATDGAAARQSDGHRHPTGPITQAGRMPIGRYGSPADIAAAVLFLASPASSYITGQILSVDGGFNVS
jgi:NAD(P)-dependent dehydrogenase (short-subunit alcohol dehydrogenase family)